MKTVLMIAGANGAGKTTTAMRLLPDFLDIYCSRMKNVDLLQLIREQYIRAWGWWGGHAQKIKNIPDRTLEVR